jgi:hypothetical protein
MIAASAELPGMGERRFYDVGYMLEGVAGVYVNSRASYVPQHSAFCRNSRRDRHGNADPIGTSSGCTSSPDRRALVADKLRTEAV